MLATIAYQAGIAVERARLAEEGTRLARAEERTRIAREIHDTLAQGLTAIGLDIEGALRHLESDPARARPRLERALTTARESLEEARRSVLDLRAAPPAGRPLAEALAALGRAFTSETGVPASVRAEGNAALPPRVEGELYRIAQEALANVRRHAQATRVEIVFPASPREAVLTVRDDGAGFDPRRGGQGRHGLLGHAGTGQTAGWPVAGREPDRSGDEDHRPGTAGERRSHDPDRRRRRPPDRAPGARRRAARTSPISTWSVRRVRPKRRWR